MAERQTTPITTKILSGLALGAFHLAGVALVATVVAFVVLGYDATLNLVRMGSRLEPVRNMSYAACAIHVALSASLWALLVIVFHLVRSRRRNLQVTSLKMSRGTVVTETLIVMPIFLLLTFGLSQLAINNIAGMLANVAVYQAGRAVWIWKPEAEAERGLSSDDGVKLRARIAAALVMTPIAPGDFEGDPRLPDEAKDARRFMLLSQVGGDLVPSSVASLAEGASEFELTTATQGNLSMSRALDMSSFPVRTVKKFTHAFQATSVDIDESDGRLGAKLSYKHMQAMPMVGRIFGDRYAPPTALEDFTDGAGMGSNMLGVGLRPGFYMNIQRTYGFKKQAHLPNPKRPDNSVIGGGQSFDGDGALRDATGTGGL